MENIKNIENEVKEALDSAKKIKPCELPPGFTDKVLSAYLHRIEPSGVVNIHRHAQPVHPYPVFFRMAAAIALIIVNVWTLRLFVNQQQNNYNLTVNNSANAVESASISDFVNEYNMNDTGDELLTSNSLNTHHE